eukprot:3525579-Amphidinium_carterae.1
MRKAETRRTQESKRICNVGLCASALCQGRGHSQKVLEEQRAALNADLGRARHEERAHSAFQVGALWVSCGEAVENLEHIVHHCLHWHKKRRESGVPALAWQAPACVRIHGFCRRRHGCLCPRMNLPWFCGRVLTLSGRLGLVGAAATPTSRDVGLAM